MANVFEVAGPGITAIDTDYVRPRMDASHLIVDQGRGAFVDTGTTHSVPNLLATLDHYNLDVGDVDYIFLTHIHLDHAGGAGALAKVLPNAKVVVHQRGAPHIVDPTRLIAGTVSVYGEDNYHALYGEIVAVDAGRIYVPKDNERLRLGEREFLLIDSPGHALHHYSLVDEDARLAFTGDCFGISYREFDTNNGPFIFPTTTPVHFDPAQMHATIDKIMSYSLTAVYLTHYSRVDHLERLADDLHTSVDVLITIARRYQNEENSAQSMRDDMFVWLSERLAGHGYQGDTATQHFLLDGDIDLNTQGLQVWLARLGKCGAAT